MRFQDLKAVQRFDEKGKLIGTYNNIFIEDYCTKIKDDLVMNVEVQFYRNLLKDFAIYDERVIAGYKSTPIGGMTVYHVSYGKRDVSSLSAFFRIYALELNAAGAIIQAPGDELYFIANINTQGKTTVKLKRGNEEISNVDVDAMTGIFTYGGRRYHAIMEIVGLGSHAGRGAIYDLVARNEKVFAGSTVTL